MRGERPAAAPKRFGGEERIAMNKLISVFAQGIFLGLGTGLCLAGLVGILYRATAGAALPGYTSHFSTYFLVVGGLMGLVAGWCLALQMVLNRLMTSLVFTVSQLIPLTARQVGGEWSEKMEMFFDEVLRPLPAIFRKVVEALMTARFRHYERVNRALGKAGKKFPDKSQDPQWLAMVALHYCLEPLWFVFFGVYAVIFLAACVFWGLPFIR